MIVIENGSTDNTVEILEALDPQVEHLRVLTHRQPLGYGGALRKGFATATKELVFYTDSDGQYDPARAAAARRRADAGCGHRQRLQDQPLRSPRAHHHRQALSPHDAAALRLHDPRCGLRFPADPPRRSSTRCIWTSYSGSVCVEFITKAQDLGFRFAEVPVHHYHRAHGKSQFFNFPRIWRDGRQLLGLWWTLRVKRAHLKEPATAPLRRGASRR